MNPVVVVVACQALFTAGDLLARSRMRASGFHPEAFATQWFFWYMVIRTIATFGQLWVLSRSTLGRTLPLFSATSVVLSVALSVVVLKEGLTARTAIGAGLAVAALVVMATGPAA